jgi:hypothetical protein
MSLDPQFPWWILANAIGGVLTAAACAAFTPVIRYIVRRLTSRLPTSPDTERAREELEGMANDMGIEERIALAATLLLHSKSLHDELSARAAETPLIKEMEATVAEFSQGCTLLYSTLASSRASARYCLLPLDTLNQLGQLDPATATSLKPAVARLLDSRSKWVSLIADALSMTTSLHASLVSVNLPALVKTTTSEYQRLERLQSKEAELESDLRHLLKRMEEASDVTSYRNRRRPGSINSALMILKMAARRAGAGRRP